MKRQIKTKLSRILCTALALCMIVALIPATFAAITEESGAFSIDFLNGGKDPGITNTDYAGRNWAYLTRTAADGAEYKGVNYGIVIKSANVGEYYAVKVKPPATGYYKIAYTYYHARTGTDPDFYPNGGIGKVSFIAYNKDTVSADINAAVNGTSSDLFTGIEYGKTSNGVEKTTEDPIRYLDVNEEYVVIISCTDSQFNGKSESFRMYATSFTFTPYEPINAVYSFAADDYTGITRDGISYANSGGRLEFYGMDDVSDSSWDDSWNAGYVCVRLAAASGWIAYKIRVPAAGEYKLTLDYNQTSSSRNKTADAYIIPASYGVDLTKATLLFDDIDFYNASAGIATKNTAFVADSAGEYLFVFHADKQSTYVRPAKLTLSENSNIPGDVGTVGGINDGETNVYIEGDEIALTYTANNSVDGTELTPEVSNVESLDTSVITIADINTANAVGAGKATITAKINGYLASWDVTVQSKALVDAFSDVDASGSVTVGEKANINILTYSTDGTQQTYEKTIEAEYNKPTSITAPAALDGYTFLYWAKGLTNKKQIIPGETVKIYPTVEATNLIAVYAPTGAAAEDKVEFYNYNGQLLDATIEGGKMPPLPSMTGYGKAKHWVHYGTDKTYEAEADASAFATGTHIFVAQYDDLQENITVTAENCTVNGGSSATVKYGDTVTCVATGDGNKTFKWWTKTVNGKTEIVSLDKDYTFKAWETCTVTAVYGDKAPTYVGDKMRIIIDELTVGGTTNEAVMAEFVGLDRAVEKGIMLGTKKIAMSSKDNQFTVINDINATDIKGYAILANGTLITDK